MAKNRDSQRNNRKRQYSLEHDFQNHSSEIATDQKQVLERMCKESFLDRYDYCGVLDLTPYLCVRDLVLRERRENAMNAKTAKEAKKPTNQVL